MASRAALLLPAALLLTAAGCASTTESRPAPRDPAAVAAEEGKARTLYAEAEEARAREDWDAARRRYRWVFEDFPGSVLASEAQYLAAECAFQDGRLYAAGELFSKYVEDRPLSPHVVEVERRLYDIGRRLIEDGKRGLWGTGIFTTSEEGVHLLRRMVVLLPTGTWADDALLEVGRWYALERDYAGAESALEELVKTYPGSEWRLEGRFLLAWAYRSDNRGPAYDGEKLKRSRAHFVEYVHQATRDADRAAEYADRIAAARAEIEAIDADMARKAILRARYYTRSGRPGAAVAVLSEAARQWGSTEPGKECAERARKLAAEIGLPEEDLSVVGTPAGKEPQ